MGFREQESQKPLEGRGAATPRVPDRWGAGEEDGSLTWVPEGHKVGALGTSPAVLGAVDQRRHCSQKADGQEMMPSSSPRVAVAPWEPRDLSCVQSD